MRGKLSQRRSMAYSSVLKEQQGYDPNPPICGNCKRYVKALPPIEDFPSTAPFCSLRGLNVSSVAICDFWMSHDGTELEHEPPHTREPVNAALLEAFRASRETLQRVNDQQHPEVIIDTIWHTPHETLFDFMDAALATAEQAQREGKV